METSNNLASIRAGEGGPPHAYSIVLTTRSSITPALQVHPHPPTPVGLLALKGLILCLRRAETRSTVG